MKSIHIRQIISIILISLSFLDIFAKDKTVLIGIDVLDKITRRQTPFSSVKLYSLPDSTFIGAFYSGHDSQYVYPLVNPMPGADYFVKICEIDRNNDTSSEMSEEIRIQQIHYEDEIIKFTIPNVIPEILKLPSAMMSRKNKVKDILLDEVAVKASRILFYHKGDTIIYNANAFILSEGSMLDALIAQLPGVELKNDGRIYCNGRFVDNLLLNGRDIFNGDKKLMLDNLAAYTVKNIAVYDKLGKDSQLMGKNIGDSKYVMDVRLKRDYLNGWIVNAEGGGGTSSRYLGKAFGMWYSDNVSISTYGNYNNLNDDSTPGRNNEQWTPDKMDTGVKKNGKGGINYTAKGPEQLWEFQGDCKFNYVSDNEKASIQRQSYFDSGDVFGYQWNNRKKRSWSFSTSHLFFLSPARKANITIIPKFSYDSGNQLQNNTEASFNEKLMDVSSDMIHNIYESSDMPLTNIINRYLGETMTKSHLIDGGLECNAFVPLNRSADKRQVLRLLTKYMYKNQHNERFTRFKINYGEDNTNSTSSNKYFNSSPDIDNSITAGATYVRYFQGSTHMDVGYNYSYLYQKRTSTVYLLNRLAGFDGFESALGVLPSMREMIPAVGASQSYYSQMKEHQNTFTPRFFSTYASTISTYFVVDVSLPLSILSRDFRYVRPYMHDEIRTSPFDFTGALKGMLAFNNSPQGKWSSRSTLTINLVPHKKDMLNTIDVLNDTDPLNLFKGNPDLKNSYEFGASVVSSFWKSGVSSKHNAKINYIRHFNAFARGILYNPENGVRTFSTYNVNGNWRIDGEYEYLLSFGPYKKFDLSSKTSALYLHSVDLSGTTICASSSMMPPQRIVNTTTIGEKLRLNMQTGQHRISIHADAKYNIYKSNDDGFTNFTSCICNYGGSGIFNFPMGWGISSDLTFYTRSGFVDSRLNTTDLIWNVRVTKSVLNGALVFVADGYDLLHQLSSVTYTVNAQARTETVRNVIPNYVLFHVQWCFNRNPKR